jgi:Alpha-kinase family
VVLNDPEVWTFENGAGEWAGRKVLQEPYIEEWEKFNSNSGWSNDDETPWHAVAQSISHFSYHHSGGQFLLCDLQGGVYDHGVVLTDPVIMSRQQGAYGVTDLGPKGITNFFFHHTCNKFCKRHWTRPRNLQQFLEPQEGTPMEEIPTLGSRPRMTQPGIVSRRR